MRKIVFILTTLFYSCTNRPADGNEKQNIDSNKVVTQKNTTPKYKYKEIVETIYFEHNSTTINKKDLGRLQRLAAICMSHTLGYLKVFGFSDTIGTEKHNNKLSEDRAYAVFERLNLNNKIDSNSVYVTWLGESDEIYDLHFPQAHFRQNSVDIWIMTGTKTNDTLVKNKPLRKTDTLYKGEKGDDKIYDLISALPEVKERAKHIEYVTKGKYHLRIEITERPKDTNGKYYWVQAGMVNDIRFEVHFNFLVYTKNFEIKYYDTVKDTIISLDTWRKETNASR